MTAGSESQMDGQSEALLPGEQPGPPGMLPSEVCLPPPSQPKRRGTQSLPRCAPSLCAGHRLTRARADSWAVFGAPLVEELPALVMRLLWESSSARLACRLQVAVRLALTARNLDLNLRANWLY